MEQATRRLMRPWVPLPTAWPAGCVRTLWRPCRVLFNDVVWRGPSREFARGWDGRFVNDEIVDPERGRNVRLAEETDSRSALLLQSVWLAMQQAVLSAAV